MADDMQANTFGNDAEDEVVLARAVHSYHWYRQQAHYNVTHRRRQSFYSLPSTHWQLLAKEPFSILETFDKVDDAIDANADIADAIVEAAKDSFLPPDFVLHDAENKETADRKATPNDMAKAQTTIRQFYRDWTAEAAQERAACYGPLLTALDNEFSAVMPSEKGSVNVLIPGAGLGRLLYEVIRRGYTAEGNEISYHQLLASSFILNYIEKPNQYTLYPFALGFSHLQNREQQLQKVMIPDVHVATELANAAAEGKTGSMGFAAGDFCSVYRTEESTGRFQAVTTSFFIDTAPNIIRYIEAVDNCLAPGGIWINLGPLLWHFDAAAPDEKSDGSRKSGSAEDGIGEPGRVELTDEEVIALLKNFGFTMEKHEPAAHVSGYIQSSQSMLQSTYRCSFWVARRRMQ